MMESKEQPMHFRTSVFAMGLTNRLGAFAFLLALATIALAPDVCSAARTITYEEAIHIALEQNLALLLADNQRDIRSVSVSEARWRFLPDLRFSLSGSESFSKTSNQDGGTTWESGRSARAGLSSSLSLFDGLADFSSLREARFAQAAGELDYRRARQTVVFQVITDYLALIEATEQERVRQESLAAQEEQTEKVRAFVEQGERPINELYQQEANVAAARLALVEARRTRELSRVDLVQTLQLDPVEEIDFAIPPLDEPAPRGDGATIETLIETASRERADLAAELQRFSASEEQVVQAKAKRWPTLSLSGSFTSQYSDASEDGILEQFDDRQSAGLGLSLTYPLFDGMETRNGIRRAALGLESAELGLAGLRQDVALQVLRAVLDRNAARESLEAATARLSAARQALFYTNERYLAGASTLFEVTLARADLISAESGEVSARYRLLWQDRLIEYYVGTLDPGAGLGG